MTGYTTHRSKWRLRHVAAAVLVLAIGVAADAGAASIPKHKVKPTPTTTSSGTPGRVTTSRPAAATTVSAITTVSATTLAPPPVSGSIIVFAASSLRAPFTDVADAFERANPKVTVTLSFAGSSTLVTQIQNGAPADLFASADEANMDKLTKRELIDATPIVFTRNQLMIVVPKGNPLRVATLADLGRPEVFVALGAPGVPVGDYARQILAQAKVDVKPKTLESNVAAIVNKAVLREIDAGIVYVTDIAVDDYRVDGVAIPTNQNIIATYPVAVLRDGNNKVVAKAFAAFTQSTTAQAILRHYKFLPVK